MTAIISTALTTALGAAVSPALSRALEAVAKPVDVNLNLRVLYLNDPPPRPRQRARKGNVRKVAQLAVRQRGNEEFRPPDAGQIVKEIRAARKGKRKVDPENERWAKAARGMRANLPRKLKRRFSAKEDAEIKTRPLTANADQTLAARLGRSIASIQKRRAYLQSDARMARKVGLDVQTYRQKRRKALRGK